MEELWKDIEGYEGLYQVSNLGRVKSLDKIDSIGRKIKGRNMKLRLNKCGYVDVKLSTDSIEKDKLVHRLVAEAFIPNTDGKHVINHIDGNKQNNCVNNLEWCTQKENIQHAFEIGLREKKRTYSKLKKEDVVYIRKHYISRDPVFGAVSLGQKFGISYKHILDIVSKKYWKDVA